MLRAHFKKHTLIFKQKAGTSRGILSTKDTYFLFLTDDSHPGRTGVGECGLLRGLSCDDRPNYEEKLQEVCDRIHELTPEKVREWPSIRFGMEMAYADLKAEKRFVLYPSDFTEGKNAIPINGLVWMGDKDFMRQQIDQKLTQGFRCIKMKIGAIDWQSELELLKSIRKRYSKEVLELRVDANGAFSASDAPKKLEELSKLKIHSIEQPIRKGQEEELKVLCRNTPIPIALDEELIGSNTCEDKYELIEEIKPQYVVLKPSLLGGVESCQEWINIANRNKVGWWITSALESNVGLNAIAQWTYTLNSSLPQGLGTGSLYTNNIPSPLVVEQGKIHYRPDKEWKMLFLSDEQ